ncbi:hypothetical protein B0H17DRAFT_1270814 [Mycena rosella]|uniref:Uncharacterized protein n=1 Tax=Mycena rosella TaxID=1033263 RepID=A0AAD7CI44_MYCRO|nr:hypothetical protein B0H17DRAFT_1270814 [Mycena rosella]
MLLSKSVATHRTSLRHQRGLKDRDVAAATRAEASTSTEIPTLNPPPAVLSMAAQFSGCNSDSDDAMSETGNLNEENPFEGTMTYGDEIFDAEGTQILFSAGETPVDNSLETVRKDLEDLAYYDHTIFADMSPMMAQLFDQTEDCTVTDAVAAMAAMECGTPDVPSFYALRKMQAKATKAVGLKPKHHTSALNNQFYMNHPNDLIRLDFANPLVRKFFHVYPEIRTTVSEFWQAAKYVEEIDNDELSPMWADWEISPHRHFYVRELAQCRNKDFVIPVKWVVYKNEVHADAYAVIREEASMILPARLQNSDATPQSGIFTVEDHKIIRVLAADLRYNYLDIMAQLQAAPQISRTRSNFEPHSPHPIRETAQGRPVFVLRIMPWADDVSGNKSKQYNAHMNMYIANINIPHRLLAQEYFVRFCSTSPHASSLELFDALSSDCKQVDWTEAYDCQLQREILFRVRAHLLPADNPQQAESASTSGSSSTYWCREDKSVPPGETRTPEETIAQIKEQIKAACRGVETAVEALQTATGVKDKIAVHWIKQLIQKAREIQKERVYDGATRDPRLNDKHIKGDERDEIKQGIITAIQEELYAWVILQPEERYNAWNEESRAKNDLRPGDHFNVLLSLRGLDPHRDSPCEILHTYLLGEDKYVWHETTKSWNDAQGELFAARLQSASFDGLNISPLRASYLVQYKKSLIRKHFKGLQQLAVFQLDDKLCSPEAFGLWKANGVLGALLWYPEIKNMDEYLADLAVAIDNVLDRWAIVEPTRIMVKYKLHVLPHIPEAVRRFGPSILFSTEVFECWNAVFRLCTPSLDIATTLADMERFKHQVSGGWWKPEGSDDWTQAGPKIRSFLTGNKQLQRRLGWTPPDLFKPGTVKRLSKAKRKSGPWKFMLGPNSNEEVIEPAQRIESSNSNWTDCKYAVVRSEDICFTGSWVFFTDGTQTIAGRVVNILVPEGTLTDTGAVVVIEQFSISVFNDARLDMPLLIRTDTKFAVKPKDILFKFNAQHDCRHFSCPLVNVAGPNQERQASKLTRKLTAHSEDSRFLLNMHALHNANLIRETLPRHMTQPKPCFLDRRAKHNEFAAKLRETGPEKRVLAQAKAQATKLRNKQDKADKTEGAQERAT